MYQWIFCFHIDIFLPICNNQSNFNMIVCIFSVILYDSNYLFRGEIFWFNNQYKRIANVFLPALYIQYKIIVGKYLMINEILFCFICIMQYIIKMIKKKLNLSIWANQDKILQKVFGLLSFNELSISLQEMPFTSSLYF